jgi:2-octaprenyl-6-methoxyphenol hydroxylase
MTRASIAVVGAGPVGLAATLLLADAGHEVALIAPAAPPPDRRTSALLQGSVELLERLGVWQELSPNAAPLRTMRIIDDTGRLIRAPEVAFSAAEIDLPAFGYNVANAELVAVLERAVAARDVRRIETLANSVTIGDDGIAIDLADGETVDARLVVAADGRRSRVREAVGIGIDEWRYDQAALVCDLRHSLPHHDTSTEFHTPHGPFTLVPLSGSNRSSLVWVDRPDAAERRAALADGDMAAEIERRSHFILGSVTMDSPRQVFPLSGMTARAFAANRVMLVGEAAHLFPPIGAQGLNLGYRDVAALGDILDETLGKNGDDPGSPAAIIAYDRARRGDILSRTAAVDALNRTLLSDFLPVQALRGLGLFLIDRVPMLRQIAMRQGVAVR